jgi:hypothetical protein
MYFCLVHLEHYFLLKLTSCGINCGPRGRLDHQTQLCEEVQTMNMSAAIVGRLTAAASGLANTAWALVNGWPATEEMTKRNNE